MSSQSQDLNDDVSFPTFVDSANDNRMDEVECLNVQIQTSSIKTTSLPQDDVQKKDQSCDNDSTERMENLEKTTSDHHPFNSEPEDSFVVIAATNSYSSPPCSPLQNRRSERPSLQQSLSTVLDANASPGSTRSYSSRSLASGRVSLSRPAGMSERIQQRLRTAHSERHLLTGSSRNLQDPDDESVTSTSTRNSRRRGISSSSSTSVRDRLSASWSNLPSVRRIVEMVPADSGDDTLLLQMTQKVRQLEEEKERLVEKQKEYQEENDATIDRLRTKLKQKTQQLDTVAPKEPGSVSTALSAASAMLELQAKLDKAMLKISRLEEEQAHHDNLEEKYQDAQVMIANLRLQATTPVRQLALDNSLTTMPRRSSESRRLILEERDQEQSQDDRQHQLDDEARKAESPPSTKSHNRARSGSIDTTTTTSTMDAPASDEDIQTRSDKLQKLKEFRKSRESQLKELVLDSQSSPTDVQSVIRNLQDELTAAKEVIHLQSLQLKEHQSRLAPHEEQLIMTETSAADESSDIEKEISVWKEKYRLLQQKYIKLEMDRAWGEFQLRDRITNDALKFHKRLRYWKEQTEEVQRQLEETMEQQAKETKELRISLSRQEQVALAAEQDLQEYKRGMTQTLKDYGVTQERLAKAMAQLAKYHPERSAKSSDPAIILQAQFLELAKERKEEKSAWTAGWMHKIRQRVPEADPATMG